MKRERDGKVEKIESLLNDVENQLKTEQKSKYNSIEKPALKKELTE